MKCKIVLPHWFDDCFKLGKKIDEGPYLLPDPEILRMGPEDAIQVPSSQHLEGAVTTRPDTTSVSDSVSSRGKLTVFRGKKVMLSSDLCLGKRFRNTVATLITDGDGQVVNDVDECDMFICQYRQGEQYVRAGQCAKDVGNLAWLFFLITHDEWCSPLRRLLHYPVPEDGIPGFKDMRIALSNYGGDARIYLENLVTAAGATFTKTMKADNTHLITARGNSEKCDAAKDWNVGMVNHLWIEESYARCEAQSLTNPKYTTFPPRTNLGEIIGQTFFDERKLRAVYYPGGEETMNAEAMRKREILEAAQDNAYQKGPAAGVVVGRIEVRQDDDDVEYAGQTTELTGDSAPPRGNQTCATPARGKYVRAGKENEDPSAMSTGSRSAKHKAISRLQGLAPDIALYEKEREAVDWTLTIWWEAGDRQV